MSALECFLLRLGAVGDVDLQDSLQAGLPGEPWVQAREELGTTLL